MNPDIGTHEELLKHLEVLGAGLSILESLPKPKEQWRHTLAEVISLKGQVINQDQENGLVSLKYFQLIQHCLQSGPLKGGKPGYFRRCTNDVKKYITQNFFPEIFGKDIKNGCKELRFTDKQADILQKWFNNARKAQMKAETSS